MQSLTPQRGLLVSFLALTVALLGMSAVAHAQSAAGTTLSVTKTATGFYEQRIQYRWVLQKTVTPNILGEIGLGATGQVTYEIEATRVASAPIDIFGVKGEICVTNGGDRPTQGLTIVDAVQSKPSKGQFQDVISKEVSLGDVPQLAAGQTHCYPYVITIPGPVQAGSSRRNQARVTILNHSGHLGEAFGPSPNTDFSLPTAPTIIETDKFATVTDVAQCPAGFTCTPSTPGPFFFSEETGSVSFTTAIKNVSAQCGATFAVTNIATLVTNDTPTFASISRTISGIETPACPPVIVGCTHTIGFWMTHPDDWPVEKLTLGTSEYTQEQLLSILSEPPKGNGLVQLARQLIAAQLNVATGATTPEGVANDITSADVLIGTINPVDAVPPVGTGYLAPGVTSSLVSTLDVYNNGLSEGGAPHCE